MDKIMEATVLRRVLAVCRVVASGLGTERFRV